jgi:hypothetical protein
MMVRVYQDGADFYNAVNNCRLFTYGGTVRDGNIDDAEIAREAFLNWVDDHHPSWGVLWASPLDHVLYPE